MGEVLAAKAGIFLASEAAKVLIELVTKRGADEAAFFVWGSRNHRERLNGRLERVQAFLEDLGNKSEHSSQLVTKWLKAVKNVAYLADNLIDDYEYQNLRTKLKLNNNNCFPRICSSYNILFRIKMCCKVREILAEFDEVDKGAQAIGLRHVELATNAIACSNSQNYNQSMISTAAWNQAREHAFVGRENDVEVLLDLMCHPNDIIDDDDAGDGLSTIAIVGMGGLGKTTLARHVYDHEKTDAQFNNNKHLISATDFNVTRILNEMVESVNLKSALSNTDVIIRNLKDKIKGNKMLVILDDVWEDNGELWDSFKGRLRGIGALPGSVILITTRKHVVAAKAGVESPHFLQPFSSDESWQILEKGLIKSNVSCHMEEVGRRIIEKCKGVPLAIKVMGSLLKSKQCLSEWEKFEKSEVWDLPQGQNEIFPSLLLSFNHLPYPSLKQCFAYFAMIPKGNYVYKSELVGLWKSQGYLRNDKRRTMEEDIGEEYIQILVSQSLLEEYEPGRSDLIRYKMHVLVHDLAAYISRNELTKDVKDLRENDGFRHLEFSSGEEMSASNFPADRNVARMIRTIRFLGCVPWDLLIHTRYLHTLFLDRTGITELPPDIERLKHLRYLDVSYNPISTLPDSIGKLYQLETLILQNCENMRKLPKVLNTLVSLRHISTTAPIYAWKGLQRLRNLQTLPRLCLDEDGNGWSIDELGELVGLRDEIYIDGLECVKDKEQAKKAGLAGKAKVTKLALSWDKERQGSICNDEDVLDGLVPHPNITSLVVEHFNGEKFPTWVTRMAVQTGKQRGIRATILSNLTVVKLYGYFRCRTLPTLGQLPFLERLVLDGFDVECIGKEFYGSDLPTTVVSFQNLKELEVSRLSRLITTWMAPPQGAFPRLEILRVTECCLLDSLPAGLGSKSLASLLLGNLNCMRSLDIIKYSTALTSLEMSNMPEIRSLPEELANCTKLTSLHIRDFEKLVSLPSGGLTTLVSLRSLDMRKCPMMEAATIDVRKLVGLSELFISCNSVQHLRTLLLALEHLPRLKSLRIEDVVPYENEDEMKDCFSEITPYNNQPSITYLVLSGRPNIKSLPRQLGLLTRITSLFIWDFEDLEEIPDWICDLSSLEELSLYGFENLKRLPSKEALQQLPRLKTLKFVLCPMLEERYAKDHGPEWHAISHVSHIVIDIPC